MMGLAPALLLLATAAQAEGLLERGRYLMQSIVACGNCHTPQTPDGPQPGMELAGQKVIEEEAFTAYAPNITQDKETGIGAWTDEQIIVAIREGRRPDGSIIGPPMPFGLYRNMSDHDVKAIVAYLRTVPPVSNSVPKSVYRIPLPENWGPPITAAVPEPSRADKVAYGAYLAGPLGHCIECHTPMVEGRFDYENQLGAGGFHFPGPWGVSVSANITPHADGIAAYTDAQLKTVIATGVRPDGSRLMPPMGVYYYKNIAADDLDAIVAYLRTLKPVPTPQ